MSLVYAVLAAVSGSSCGGAAAVPASKQRQQNVMVIDEGIDLSISELQGKVVAALTETCADTGSGGTSDAGSADGGDAGPSFADLKQQFLAGLAIPDDSCHLTAGIVAKADPLQSIEQFRARWNAMIRANETIDAAFTPAEISILMPPLVAELNAFGYHGTATSSTVAHDNAAVRLVLVERQLASESQAQADFTCFVQSDIDQLVALLSDPDVFAAAVAQPATLDADLAATMAQYDVGIVNQSFGSPSRAALETLQAMTCPTPIDLAAYYSIVNKIDLAHAKTVAGPAVLTVQAAGNDGAEVDSGADLLECDIGDPIGLLIGSYDPGNLQQNTFSNFGACVDGFAPGQSIVTTYAGGWLVPAAGTSFAAPLTVRDASMNTPTPFDPAQARSAVLAQLNQAAQLPLALFPDDFFWIPAETPTAALIAGGGRPTLRPRVTEAELARVLGPLRRFKSLRR